MSTGKHHQTYVNKLNELVKDSDDPKHAKLESIIKFEKGPVYNQAAQVWNHNFYFQCLGTPTPDTDSPIGPTQKRIDRDFGSLENFKQQFKEKVVGHFGSGQDHQKQKLQQQQQLMLLLLLLPVAVDCVSRCIGAIEAPTPSPPSLL
ncbi:hypothetical protein Emag_002716 [Eimeria magna]